MTQPLNTLDPNRTARQIGRRLREFREAGGFSQGFIEERTGLLRCYVSRVECGYTVPQIETLERWTEALGLSLSEFFAGHAEGRKPARRTPYGKRLTELLARLGEKDQRLLLAVGTTLLKQRGRRGGD